MVRKRKKLLSRKVLCRINDILRDSGRYWAMDGEYHELADSAERVTFMFNALLDEDGVWYDEYIRYSADVGYEVWYNPRIDEATADGYDDYEALLQIAIPLGKFRRLDHALKRLDLIRGIILGEDKVQEDV